MKVQHLECYPERNLFISASLDGHAKVWNIKKELIREIKFPESVRSATFLDDGCDILVGHQGRISLVSSKDYVPDEIKRLYAPTQEDMKNFCQRRRKVATCEIFEGLKLKDDEMRR